MAMAMGAAGQMPADPDLARDLQWITYSGDHAVTRRWGVHFEASLRLEDDSAWTQWLLRPGVSYQLGRHVQLSAWYAHTATHAQGFSGRDGAQPEHRLQQQLTVAQPFRRWRLTHRFRLDQRFLGSGTVGGAERVWRLQHRPRYMVRLEAPLRNTDGPGSVYAAFSNELLFRLGYAGQSALDQNRFYGGLGVRPSRPLVIEAGLMHQRYQPLAGGAAQNNVVLLVTVKNQMPLRRLLGLE